MKRNEMVVLIAAFTAFAVSILTINFNFSRKERNLLLEKLNGVVTESESLRHDNKSLAVQIEVLNQAKRQTDEKIEKAMKLNAESEATIAKVREEVFKYKDSIQGLDKKNTELNEKLKIVAAEKSSLENEKLALVEQNKAVAAENQATAQALSRCQDSSPQYIRGVMAKIDELNLKVNELERENYRLKNGHSAIDS
jgi:chromosome segregation ATPase